MRQHTMGQGRRHLLSSLLLTICLQTASTAATCVAEERDALLDFIKPLEFWDHCRITWNSSLDCCDWSGIQCGKSGHVYRVNIGCLLSPILGNSSIFKLRFVQYMEFWGGFPEWSIPEEIGTLHELVDLRIPFANLTGSIPVSLCNLQNLRRLELQDNRLTGELPPCLFDIPKLNDIVLWSNRIDGFLPNRVNNVTGLKYLGLGGNQVTGIVPAWLFTLPSLIYLDLSNNNLTGPIEPFKPPPTTKLREINLRHNRIRGAVPASLFQLVRLTSLDLMGNLLNGDIEWSWIKGTRHLRSFYMSANRGLSLKNSNGSKIQFSTSLETLDISSCGITEFPSFLSSQGISSLDVSNNKIGGRIFPRGGGGWRGLSYFSASHNFITGFDEFPEGIDWVDLSFNKLQGPLLPPPPNISCLLLSNNQFSGEIPIGFCNQPYLFIIDLSFNNLSGVLPPCLMNASSILKMNLQGNRFHGAIPDVSLPRLTYLILSDNNFEGMLTRSLKDCKSLAVLDVGNNNISDTFPGWLENHSYLQILILRSNRFHGEIGIPTVESPFKSLQILDISFNSFSGSIPDEFISNLGFMKNLTTDAIIGERLGGSGGNPILQYPKFNKEFIFHNFTIIDFSGNRFSGPIPIAFGQLNALKVLNLSRNDLSETIPLSLGNIRELELLDLSRNMLVGRIPQGLMELSFLEFLNVSYNKLDGQIPTGNRSELFSNSSYIGNVGLCGFPLSKLC